MYFQYEGDVYNDLKTMNSHLMELEALYRRNKEENNERIRKLVEVIQLLQYQIDQIQK